MTEEEMNKEEELRAGVLVKIKVLENAKIAVDNFIKNYEEAVASGGNISYRPAKSGAKALKLLVKTIDEYEEVY